MTLPWLSRIVSPLVTVVAWTCFVLIGATTVGVSLVQGETFSGADLVASIDPWESALETTDRPTNPYVGDTVDSVIPQTTLIVEAAREGYLAEWNPYQVGGAELGGLPNPGIYSPLSLPWWLLPSDIAPAVVKLLELTVIALGMSLFLRRLGTHPASWGIASTVYAYSGFMVAWTNWPQTRVAALVPLLFWALDRVVVRRTAWGMVPVGFVVAAMLLGGFPAVVGYALYFGAAYVLVRAVALAGGYKRVLAAGGRALGGVLLGLLLSAWQMLPFAYNAMTVIDLSARAQLSSHHLLWDHLATALVPDILGRPDGDLYWGGVNPVERFSYIGVAALVLIAASLFVRSTRSASRLGLVFSLVALSLCVVLTYHGGTLLALVQHLPIFSNNPVGRLRVMVGFFAAILSAYGFSALLSPRGVRGDLLGASSHRTRGLTLAGVLGAGGLGVSAVLLVRSVMIRVPNFAEVTGDLRQAFAIGIAAGLLVLLVWLWPSRLRSAGAAAAIAVLVAYPATQVGLSWWPRVDRQLFYAQTPTHQFLDEQLDDQRYASVGQVMLPGSSTHFYQRSFGGHVFMPSEWKDLVVAVDEAGLLSPTYVALAPGSISTWIGSGVLDRFAVTYVVTAPTAEILGVIEAADGGVGTSVLKDGAQATSPQLLGPVRGVRLALPAPAEPGTEGATVTVTVRDLDGHPLTSTTVWVDDARDVLWVALEGDDFSADAPWTFDVTVDGSDASIPIALDSEGLIASDLVRPVDDDLKIVHTGDSTIYERGSALDRVRWASEEVVIESPEERVQALAAGLVSDVAVVLENAEDAHGLDGRSRATVEELDTDLNHLRVDVDADGAGWVVVADSFRREGWSATVDGQPVPLTAAEHAGGAVFVGAGVHTVELTYQTPGLRQGVAVSGATAGVLALGGAVWTIGYVRRPRPVGHPQDDGEDVIGSDALVDAQSPDSAAR